MKHPEFQSQHAVARHVLLSGDRYRPETRALAWAVLATARGRPSLQRTVPADFACCDDD